MVTVHLDMKRMSNSHPHHPGCRMGSGHCPHGESDEGTHEYTELQERSGLNASSEGMHVETPTQSLGLQNRSGHCPHSDVESPTQHRELQEGSGDCPHGESNEGMLEWKGK